MKTNLIKDLVIRPNTKVKLNEWDPDYDGGIFKKEVESTLNKDLLDRMSDLQYKLFANKNQSLLIILQGIDTSGKDSTIRHVMGAFNPQSCRVKSFKAPNDEELSHDYLWRIHKVTPAKGEIVLLVQGAAVSRLPTILDRAQPAANSEGRQSETAAP